MDEAQVKKDLEDKVFAQLQDIVKLGMEKLKRLEASGAGILDDHKANGCNFTTPFEFIQALAMEIDWQYRLNVQSRADKRRVTDYHLMM